MSLILAWVLFPLVLTALGAGWGVLVERAGGVRVNDALLLPLGLAGALVVAGVLTTYSATAPAAVPVVAVGAAAGLVLWAWERRLFGAGPAGGSEISSKGHQGPRRWPLPGGWPLLAAVGALLAYGAPVLLSGQATFTGYDKLDDTATWLNVIDHVMSHARSIGSEAPSTYSLVFADYGGSGYPLGGFMLVGVGHGLTGIDAAWIIQPYFACCAAALALCVYALAQPLVPSRRLRALVAFLAAQPALLYGYSLWGGIKEMTAAFVIALGVALAVPLLRRPPVRLGELRAMLPLAVAAAALIQTLGVGGGGWVGPALVVLAAAWLILGRRRARLGVSAAVLGGLVAIAAVLILPVWDSLNTFFRASNSALYSEGQTAVEKFGNLVQPLSGWQLAGIWPSGDFRFTAPAMPTVLFIVVVLIAAGVGLWLGVRRRQFGPALYVAVALLACGLVYIAGATPWVVGKALAISSPAVLTAALTGAAMLWGSRRARSQRIAGDGPASGGASWITESRRYVWVLGPLTMVVIAAGVLWSNVLAYSDVTLAPRSRFAELQHLGGLLAGKGPTFINEYDIYADRHFLRAGAPVEPSEERSAQLALRNGTVLTRGAFANLDAYSAATLLPYRSIVTRRSPIESRPPSIYQLVWQGRYYQLWQRPEPPATTILEHIPYGEALTSTYCGTAVNGPAQPLCSINPVSIPPCPQLIGLARSAQKQLAHLVAFQRPEPVFARGDEVRWPGAWIHEPVAHALLPTSPGTAVGHLMIPSAQNYELFLRGSFGRGVEVRVDGRTLGSVKDQLAGIPMGLVPVSDVFLFPGVHTVEYEYHSADLTPGSGETLGNGKFARESHHTLLAAIVLEPLQHPPSELISVSPAEARSLCGRPLNWVEIVR